MQLIALIHFFERGHHIYVCNSETMSISMLMCARKNTEKKEIDTEDIKIQRPLLFLPFLLCECVCVCVYGEGGIFYFVSLLFYFITVFLLGLFFFCFFCVDPGPLH